MRHARKRSLVRIEVLVGVGLGLYIVGTVGFLAFGTAFFVAFAFLLACAACWARATTVARKRRLARERRQRRSRRIEAHDAVWLEDNRAA